MTTMRVVGECFFWYRLTRVFPDKFHRAVKRLCCVCVCSDVEVPKSNLKTIAICHNLISQSQRMYTAITLDLAIQVHHDFRSKNLIDILHSLGHCVSYDEVRRFLTSVAVDKANGTGDTYIPKRLQN